MAERILLLTGHLAEPRLKKILESVTAPAFAWRIADVGVKVAALMTEAIILNRLPRPIEADRIILPGRCRADLARLSAELGVTVERGPDELVDLPAYLGLGGRTRDLSQYDIRIFSEMTDAPVLKIDKILQRAEAMQRAGADIIDLGCLPDTPFPHLEDAVKALKSAGFKVSVDSASADELRRGAAAGADYLLSLTETTLHIAKDFPVTPVLISEPHGDLDSLARCAAMAAEADIDVILDPVIDPIHFGFADSLERYSALRRLLPEAEMMMGTGNLTELTEADSSGVTALLLGLCSELAIRNVLVVQVSPHTRRTLQEHDAARRLMFASRADRALPKHYRSGLAQIHDLKPYLATPAEITDDAASVRDTNFRIQTSEDGIHVFNRDMHIVGKTAMELFSRLDFGADSAHAFYIGTELAKAELAFVLGKRYVQDEPLDFGCATDRASQDLTQLKEAGATLRAGKAKD